jgi:hypothetical protein
MTSHKAQQDSEARPPALQAEAKGTRPLALQAEAKGALSVAVARTDTMKAIGDGGN